MFDFFSKKIKTSKINYSQIRTDIHSHLLPGIDDGSPDIKTSLELIKGLKELGYSKLITTPHIFWDLYKNTPDFISQKLGILQKALLQEHINIEIKAAAEYFLDDYLSSILKKKEPLLTIHNNMVLVEFSTIHKSLGMKNLLFDLQMAGYQPILAHPERYIYLYKEWPFFYEIKENGILFQLNLLSITGGYGKRVKEMAAFFLENGFYSLIGTDLHHSGHLKNLKNLEIPQLLQRSITNGDIINHSL